MSSVNIKAEITGNVWKIVKSPGDSVEEDEAVMILESMKMEIPVMAPQAGVIEAILVAEGDTVSDGAVVARLQAS
jgi:acetyl-CoA carboxylase biotin carboxyl carrier protein